VAREIFTAAGGAAPEAPVSTRPARLSSICLVIAEAVRRNPPRPPRWSQTGRPNPKASPTTLSYPSKPSTAPTMV